MWHLGVSTSVEILPQMQAWLRLWCVTSSRMSKIWKQERWCFLTWALAALMSLTKWPQISIPFLKPWNNRLFQLQKEAFWGHFLRVPLSLPVQIHLQVTTIGLRLSWRTYAFLMQFCRVLTLFSSCLTILTFNETRNSASMSWGCTREIARESMTILPVNKGLSTLSHWTRALFLHRAVLKRTSEITMAVCDRWINSVNIRITRNQIMAWQILEEMTCRVVWIRSWSWR